MLPRENRMTRALIITESLVKQLFSHNCGKYDGVYNSAVLTEVGLNFETSRLIV